MQSASRSGQALHRAGQHERADHHQHDGGDQVAPGVQPAPADPAGAAAAASVRPTIVAIVTAAKIASDATAVPVPTVAAARKTGRIVTSGEAAAPNGTITAASPRSPGV